MGSDVLKSKQLPSFVAALVAIGVVLFGLHTPLGDDDLFGGCPRRFGSRKMGSLLWLLYQRRL